MSGLNPSLGANLKTAAVGTIGGGFAGYNMYALGYLGDYLRCYESSSCFEEKVFEAVSDSRECLASHFCILISWLQDKTKESEIPKHLESQILFLS